MREDFLGFTSVKKEPKPVPILGAIRDGRKENPSAGNVRLTTRDLMTPAAAPKVSLCGMGMKARGRHPPRERLFGRKWQVKEHFCFFLMLE